MLNEAQKHAQQVKSRLMGTPSIKPNLAATRMVSVPPPEPEPIPPRPLPSYELPWRDGVKDILVNRHETMDRLCSRQKDHLIVECRKEIARYLRDRNWSLTRIGNLLNRDHSCVHALLDTDEQREARKARVKERNARNNPRRAYPVDCTTVAVFGANGWTLGANRDG